MNYKIIRIGTRKSRLALIQSRLVADAIEAQYPDIKTELVPISTRGDMITDRSLLELGGKGLFTHEIENALLYKSIDLAVHSAKDMPLVMRRELNVVPVLKREDPCDIIVSLNKISLRELKKGSVVGTGSMRRGYFAKLINPDIIIKPIRGNVLTRLEKLKNDGYDAIILAAAGFNRLYNEMGDELLNAGSKRFISCGNNIKSDYNNQHICNDNQCIFNIERMDPEIFLPAAAQGILAGQYAYDNNEIAGILKSISDKNCVLAYNTEREFLKNIGADCNALYGIYCRSDNAEVVSIFSAYGIYKIETLKAEIKAKDALKAARDMALKLKNTAEDTFNKN